MTKTQRTISGICLLLSGVVVLLGLGGVLVATLALAQGDRTPQVFFLLGFEAVVVLAGVFGVLTGLGRVREGRGLAILIAGGCAVVAGVLVEPAVVQLILQRLQGSAGPVASQPVAGISLLPFALGQIVLGVMLSAVAAAEVLARKPGRSLPRLARGLVLAVPVIVVGGGAAFLMSGGGRGVVRSLPPGVWALAFVVAALVLIAFVSASGHYLIRAFEVADEPEGPEQPAPRG